MVRRIVVFINTRAALNIIPLYHVPVFGYNHVPSNDFFKWVIILSRRFSIRMYVFHALTWRVHAKIQRSNGYVDVAKHLIAILAVESAC